MNMQKKQTWIFRLALLATAITCIVVVLGAFTRLSNAGLGCPDWPGCYGHLTWPTTVEHVVTAEKLFPESPVEHDKTWPEMVHRHFAGLLGLLILTLATVAWFKSAPQIVKQARFHVTALLVLVVLQALFGMWTVTLKLWPQVVTAHLLGGFTTLTLLWLLIQRFGQCIWMVTADENTTLQKYKALTVVVLVLVILQIALGGWASSNYAALACADFPLCHGQWWPVVSFAEGFNLTQTIGPNYLGGLLEGEARTAIHLGHRLGALIVSIAIIGLVIGLWLSKAAQVRPMAAWLLLVLVVQIGLGVTNVLASLPLAVAVAHNAVGAVLLLSLVTLTHRLFTASEIERTYE